jgi:hypothetical protein
MQCKPPKPDRLLEAAWIFLAVIVLGLVIIIRIRLLGIPLERDEGEYAYIGQLLLQGIPPYKLAYNLKFPGTYAACALIMALFGQTIIGIHLGLLLINTATILLIFLLGRRPGTVQFVFVFSRHYFCELNCACARRRLSAAPLNSGLRRSAASNSGMLSRVRPDARRAKPRLL